jgi:hypothetical protein
MAARNGRERDTLTVSPREALAAGLFLEAKPDAFLSRFALAAEDA